MSKTIIKADKIFKSFKNFYLPMAKSPHVNVVASALLIKDN